MRPTSAKGFLGKLRSGEFELHRQGGPHLPEIEEWVRQHPYAGTHRMLYSHRAFQRYFLIPQHWGRCLTVDVEDRNPSPALLPKLYLKQPERGVWPDTGDWIIHGRSMCLSEAYRVLIRAGALDAEVYRHPVIRHAYSEIDGQVEFGGVSSWQRMDMSQLCLMLYNTPCAVANFHISCGRKLRLYSFREIAGEWYKVMNTLPFECH